MNWVDTVILVFYIYMFFVGLFNGIIRTLASVFSIIISIAISILLTKPILNLFPSISNSIPPILLTIILILLLLPIITRLFSYLLIGRIIYSRRKSVIIFDRLIGALIFTTLGIFVIGLLVSLFYSLNFPFLQDIIKPIQDSKLAKLSYDITFFIFNKLGFLKANTVSKKV